MTTSESHEFGTGRRGDPLEALRVTSDFFHAFQMDHDRSRLRTAGHDAARAGVVILSDGTWRQRFQADPDIVGRAITLGNEKHTVIGVAHPKFQLDARVDVWVPLRIAEGPRTTATTYNFVGRLKAGVTPAQAEADLRQVLLQLKSTYPNLWNQYESVRVVDTRSM